MTITRLALQSFSHYRRTHAAVALGVAAAVAVMAGALLVGASVRASLAGITAGRLGRTGIAVGAETPFTEALAGRAQAALGLRDGDVAPLLTLDGHARHESSGRRASRVAVYGVDRRFFAFHGVDRDPPSGSAVLLSPDLAAELGAGDEDAVIVRVSRPTDVPLDSLHGRKDEAGRSMRLTMAGVLARDAMGEFSLSPGQAPVRAAFVALDRLQRDLALEPAERVNTLLVHTADDGSVTASAVRAALGGSLAAADIGIRFTIPETTEAIIVEAAAGLISDPLAATVTTMAGAEGLDVTPVLTWLANGMRIGDRTVPYSLVTAIGPTADGDAELARLLRAPAGGDTPGGLPPIVLNDWTARELAAAPGDTLDVEYYRWATEGRLETARTAFRVAAVVPMRGVTADRRLAPDYPGISDTDSLADWTPPFPIDLGLVRPVDEDYWRRFRATPKAFIPIDAGRHLWQTRHGATTSLRLGPADGAAPVDLPAVADRLRTGLPRAIEPSRAGIAIADVRAQNLAASAGATDFGAYFFYFSFFLVVSAILLAALFFRLSVEHRLSEIGLLRAEGYTLRQVRRVFLIEGSLVSLAGAVAGTALAVAWAAIMMYGLRTWWVGAVGTTALTLRVEPLSMAIGAAGGALAGLGSMAITIRGLSRLSPRALLTGASALSSMEPRTFRSGDSTGPSRPALRSTYLAALSFLLAVALSTASLVGVIPAAGGFFGAGAMALVGGLAAFRRWLLRPSPASVAGRGAPSLVRLGLQNASWRPGRSLTAAALVAAAVFLLVSVDSFRKHAGDDRGPASGTGGFALIAESALPLVHDPSTAEGRDALGLEFPPGEPALASVGFFAVRLRQGEDASCLNLYQPKQPRVMGLPQRLIDANRFSFSSSLATTGIERENPWRLLGPIDALGRVPAILDASTLQYVFHKGVGDEVVIDAATEDPVRLHVVGALADSMLQGEVLIAEAAFEELYPDVAGYRVVLLDVPDLAPARVSVVASLVEERLEPYGVDAQDTARRLEAYHRVENTYLSTFQTLGGLGLLLGSLGLIAVIARNVLERRRELALLGAAGYSGRQLQLVVVAEHLALIAAGLAAGLVAAMIAIAPVLIERGGGVPPLPLVWIGAVAIAGVAASLVATRGVRRLPLVPSLRSE
jgi:hypothetical protein